MAVVMTTNQGPRLELARVDRPTSAAPGQSTQWLAEVRLTLINDGSQPVEAREHSNTVPRIFDATGKPVTMSDYRSIAGYAPPGLPEPPVAPVRRGERRQLDSYSLMRTPDGYQFQGPYGAAVLSSGRYRIEVELDVGPTTREAWITAHAAAVLRPGPRPKDPRAEAVRAAAKYEDHWREAPNFFQGHLKAPPFELMVP